MTGPIFNSLSALYTAQEWGTPKDGSLQNAFAEKLGTPYYSRIEPLGPKSETEEYMLLEKTLRADGPVMAYGSDATFHPVSYQHFDQVTGTGIYTKTDVKRSGTIQHLDASIKNNGTDKITDYGNLYYYDRRDIGRQIDTIFSNGPVSLGDAERLKNLEAVLVNPIFSFTDNGKELYASSKLL